MKTIFSSWMNWLSLISTLYAFAFLFGLTPVTYDGYPVWQTFALGVIAVITFFCTFFSSMEQIKEHGRELGFLRTVDAKIEHRKKYVQAVKKNFKELESVLTNTLDKIPEQLMNHDNPVAALVDSLMDEVSEAEGKLVNIKQEKETYQSYIEARKIGPYSWIVDYYGDK